MPYPYLLWGREVISDRPSAQEKIHLTFSAVNNDVMIPHQTCILTFYFASFMLLLINFTSQYSEMQSNLYNIEWNRGMIFLYLSCSRSAYNCTSDHRIITRGTSVLPQLHCLFRMGRTSINSCNLFPCKRKCELT